MEIKPVAYYHCELKGKFGLPRQAGLVTEVRGRIELCKEYSSPDALRGLDGFDYIWLIWGFNLNKEGAGAGSLTVRPPRLGGNERVGVFASRSPYRPNPLGLSSVKIDSIEDDKGIINIKGADLADGTPIYDIKPYIEYADSHTAVRSGFTDGKQWQELEVIVSEDCLKHFDKEQIESLTSLLSQDPRPRYQNDPDRVYGLCFADKNIRFQVCGQTLRVISVD